MPGVTLRAGGEVWAGNGGGHRGYGTGDHVHSHNAAVADSHSDQASNAGVIHAPPARTSFQGYLRPNGRVGTRNFIGIMASVNCSSTICNAIADKASRMLLPRFPNIDGFAPIVHDQGCGMASSGEGFDALVRVLKGYRDHPNFGGVLIVGLGCEFRPAAATSCPASGSSGDGGDGLSGALGTDASLSLARADCGGPRHAAGRLSRLRPCPCAHTLSLAPSSEAPPGCRAARRLTDEQPLLTEGRAKGAAETVVIPKAKVSRASVLDARPIRFCMTASKLSDYTGAADLPGSLLHDRCPRICLSAVARRNCRVLAMMPERLLTSGDFGLVT